MLAGEALADTELVATVLKDATLRRRPIDILPNKSFSDSWFEGRGSASYVRGDGSFPSGHAIAAVAVAIVIARRYGNHRWVPYVAYGLAGLVAFSRLSLSAHFLSDVFMGVVGVGSIAVSAALSLAIVPALLAAGSRYTQVLWTSTAFVGTLPRAPGLRASSSSLRSNAAAAA